MRNLTEYSIRRYMTTTWSAAALLAALAGCSTLPTIVPDMGRRPEHAVQLQGARGPLTAQQSKAILARLKSRGEETSIFDRHLALEEDVAGTPLTVGNKVLLLQNGPATYKSMFAAIRNAKDHINMETYIIEDDDVGNSFVDALIAKQAEGVQVNFIHDGVGSMDAPKAFFKRLTDSGVNVLEFNPINPLTAGKGWDVNQRDHRKLLVVDGEMAFVGGINISSVYSGGSKTQRNRLRRRKRLSDRRSTSPRRSLRSRTSSSTASTQPSSRRSLLASPTEVPRK